MALLQQQMTRYHQNVRPRFSNPTFASTNLGSTLGMHVPLISRNLENMYNYSLNKPFVASKASQIEEVPVQKRSNSQLSNVGTSSLRNLNKYISDKQIYDKQQKNYNIISVQPKEYEDTIKAVKLGPQLLPKDATRKRNSQQDEYQQEQLEIINEKSIAIISHIKDQSQALSDLHSFIFLILSLCSLYWLSQLQMLSFFICSFALQSSIILQLTSNIIRMDMQMNQKLTMEKEEAPAKQTKPIRQQLKTTDPLQIVRQLLKYLQGYADKLEEQKENTSQNKKQVTLTTRYPTVQIKRQHITKAQNEEMVYPSRKTRWVKYITPVEQKQKFQEQKFIAFSFIDYGVNYHYLTQHYPDMPPKNYRCYVEAINNQTVNQIVDFLRYQCNLEVQRLNRDQKRSIRTQLTKIRQWLGHKDPQQLNTFYTFIKRHYDRSLEVSMESALKLYKIILCIIRSPYVNVLEAQQMVDKQTDQNGERLTLEEQKAMIISFIKWKDLHKVSDLMCQKYGYDMKWSFHSVKEKLKLLLFACIDKLIKHSHENEQDKYRQFFTENKKKILDDSNQLDLKIKLFSFYLQKRASYVKIKNLYEKLRDFYEIYGKDDSSNISIPKLQDSSLNRLNDSVKLQDKSEFILDETIKKEEYTACNSEESQQSNKLDKKEEVIESRQKEMRQDQPEQREQKLEKVHESQQNHFSSKKYEEQGSQTI